MSYSNNFQKFAFGELKWLRQKSRMLTKN